MSPSERDKQFAWHPFTQMAEWISPDFDPVVIESGSGAVLRDARGREFIDGNASIWTNIHGHGHPAINAAIRDQLDRVAHVSFLGFTHEPAALLAQRLVGVYPAERIERVFFSDNGSTAIEVAIKMAVQFWQQNGAPERTGFAAFENAYHGDTMGASSLGGVRLFHQRFSAHQFPVCHVASVAELDAETDPSRLAAVVIEPLIQGVNRMRLWPEGMLRELRGWCDRHGVFLIADEILTGFGRTGSLFACEREGVEPDFVALAKGLTGGYLPLAATLVSGRVFDGFLGDPAGGRTFFYGHSYSANPLGCAAALASLDLFESERTLEMLAPKIDRMRELLEQLRGRPNIGETRQCGFMAGIDLVDADGEPFRSALRMGRRVCEAAAAHGLLTRPILDTVVLLPPLCITREQLAVAVAAIDAAVAETCRSVE